MIPVEIWYRTYDEEFITIVEAFKSWYDYLEDCKYEILILTDHNRLRQVIYKELELLAGLKSQTEKAEKREPS